MEHIKQTVEEVISNLVNKKPPEAEKVFRLFRENLDRGESRHARCDNLRKGVLTVNVDSSAWLYQLSLKKEGLLKKLQLKDIRFRIGEVK